MAHARKLVVLLLVALLPVQPANGAEAEAPQAAPAEKPESPRPKRAADEPRATEPTEAPLPAEAAIASTAAGCADSRECARREGYGNVCADGKCLGYLDRTDLLDVLGISKGPAPAPKPFKLLPAIIPAVGYNPALGFLIGVVANFGMYLGDPERTTISNLSALVLLTTNSQLQVQLTSTLMTSRNEWELQGDWRFLVYNQNTYGLGTGPTPLSQGITIGGWGETAAITGGQLIDFDLVRVHETVLKRVVAELYLGGGYRLDRYYAIVDQSLNLSASPPVVTSHFAYNTIYGFDTAEYTVSGLSLDALYDSRDSTINAYRGTYGHAAFRFNPTWLGSSQASTLLYGEFRAYVGLCDEVPRNVLAFWLIAQGVTGGHLPYLALPSITWDARSTTGRGYVQGRFRGTAEVYGEAEWRFRLSRDGFLGGALFVNAVTFSSPAVNLPAYGYSQPAQNLFQYVKPAGGFGLRFMMNKESRTNVRLDFAWGVDSFGVYLGAGEAF